MTTHRYEFPRTLEAEEILDRLAQAEAESKKFLGHLSGPPGFGKHLVLDELEARAGPGGLVRLAPLAPGAPPDAQAWLSSVFEPLTERFGQPKKSEGEIARALGDLLNAGRDLLAMIDDMIPQEQDTPLIVIEDFEQLAKHNNFLVQLAEAWPVGQRRFHLLTCSAFAWEQLAGNPTPNAFALRGLPVPPSRWEEHEPSEDTTVSRERVDRWVDTLVFNAKPDLSKWLGPAPNRNQLTGECLQSGNGHPLLVARLLQRVLERAQTSRAVPVEIDDERASWPGDEDLEAQLIPYLSGPDRCPESLLRSIADRANEWVAAAREDRPVAEEHAAATAAIGLPPADQPRQALSTLVTGERVKKHIGELREEIVRRRSQAANELTDRPEIKQLIAGLKKHFDPDDQEDDRETRIVDRSIRESFSGGGATVYQLDVERTLLDYERGKKKKRRGDAQDRADRGGKATYKFTLTVYTGLTAIARKLWVSQLATLRRMADAGLPAIRPISRGASIYLEKDQWAGYILTSNPPRTLAKAMEARVELLKETSLHPAALPRVLIELSDAVRHMHKQGVLHRHIDLEHIGVAKGEGRDGLPLLTLEGFERSMLLRAAMSGARLDRMQGGIDATERLFLPPEAQAIRRVDAETRFALRWANADVYSFGVLVTILIAGLPALSDLSAILAQIDDCTDPIARAGKARELRGFLLGLQGWEKDASGNPWPEPWRSYSENVKAIVGQMLEESEKRPSINTVHQKLKYEAREYKKAFDEAEQKFAVTYSPQHTIQNIPRYLLPRELDFRNDRDLATLRDQIDMWIAEATEIQFVPEGFTMANSAASKTAGQSTIMIVGPEVVFFAAYQKDGGSGSENERLLRLNFTVDRRSTVLAPIPDDHKVSWPSKVLVYPTTEIETDEVAAEVEGCQQWPLLVRRAEHAVDTLPKEALLAVATWRFHLRLLSVYRTLRDFPVIISQTGSNQSQLVLDVPAYNKILGLPINRMVFGTGQPADFFAAELARWRDELTAGSGKLQLLNTESGYRFDVTIRDIDDHRITVSTPYNRRLWPSNGVLHFAEDAGQRVAERRQTAGVDALICNDRILRRLVDGGQDSVVHIRANPEFNSMQEALDNIKSSWPLSAVNGPPGTGKTTLMANLVREILDDDPAARILLTSQSHAAVDNAIERINAELEKADGAGSAPPLIRSYSAFTRNKVSSNSLRHHDTAELVRRMRDGIRSATQTAATGNRAMQRAIETLRKAADSKTNEWARRIERSAPLVAATTSAASLSDDYQKTEGDKWDWVLCDEAGRAFGIELAQPMAVAQRVVMTGDYKQLPPYRIEDIEAAIREMGRRVKNGQVTNLTMDMLQIGGNVEKAIDWLVPFKRLMRLNGKEPFRPDIGQKKPGVVPVTQELSTQYRSLEPIGRLVSEAFYNKSVKTAESLRQIPDEPALPLGDNHDPVLCWIDTGSQDGGSEERPAGYGMSLHNPLEARVAAALGIRVFKRLEREEPDRLRDPRQLSETIRILSPYTAQVSLIRDTLNARFLVTKDRQREFGPAVHEVVGTVDSAQGAEADVCIYSWVRSRANTRLPDEDAPVRAWEAALRGQFGFLLKRERMNVLMSRARKQMIVIGNRQHFDQFETLRAGLVNAMEGSPGDGGIDVDDISFWSVLLAAFDPDKDWDYGRRVVALHELGLDP